MLRTARLAPALAPLLVALAAGVVVAGYPLLHARPALARPGQEVELRLADCLPFPGEARPVLAPVSAVVHAPDGTFTDLGPRLAGEDAREWTVGYTPALAGDHVFDLQLQPFEEGDHQVHDFVKLVLHVAGSQQGWDRTLRRRLEVTPLTRPYGLAPGAVFRGAVTASGAPVAGALVRVERWSGTPGGEVPEHLQHGLEKTDAGGAFAVALDRAGWWLLSAESKGRTVSKGGRRLEERLRATLWVHVGE